MRECRSGSEARGTLGMISSGVLTRGAVFQNLQFFT